MVSDNDKNEIIKTAKEFYDNEGRVTGAINKIFYGAPGTGKSYKVDSLFNNFERVTFHPEYTYFDFVGGLRPVQNEDKSVSYSFVPGIFTDILIKAVENKTKNIGIIIEEINRANTAAVFGDLFQLLDRDDDGQSKYIIKNKDICDYIENKTGKKCESIYIPSNMSIVATMNSADQGVFVMDSAFKRRWQFEYMPISFDAEDLKDVKIAGFDMYWKDFGAILNEHLSSEEVDVDEDKLIGQRFINKHDMQDKDLIASKLLIYLWDDVVRYN
ncbi:AAA family ATPase, partial [Staphylococcus pasteuri]|uniref:AAA family ATPase n=1 Tax=Staphylococcus pasteuri TaxID=45972 RepID=UPI001C7203F0